MKKQTVYLIISALLFTLTAVGQNKEDDVSSLDSSKTSVLLSVTNHLNKSSKTGEMVINVPHNTKKVVFHINSSITNGGLTIKVCDPNEIMENTFTLKSRKKETAKGDISRALHDPQPGYWRIKTIPSNATGIINIEVYTIEED